MHKTKPREKSDEKYLLLFKKLPYVNIHPMGENSPNLVTRVATRSNLVAIIDSGARNPRSLPATLKVFRESVPSSCMYIKALTLIFKYSFYDKQTVNVKPFVCNS
jgi:hypothetical protein